MSQSIQLLTSPAAGASNYQLATVRPRLQSISWNEHGPEQASIFIPCDTREQFYWLTRQSVPHAIVAEGAWPIWAGRGVGVKQVRGGVVITARGYWDALNDELYTAFWSKTSTTDFGIVPESITNFNPGMYNIDQNNRLFFGLKKNATYANNADAGALWWAVPSGSRTQIKRISFDYAFALPAVNRRMRVSVMNYDRTSGVNYDTTLNGSGSGTFTQDISANPRDRVEIQLYNISGAANTYAGEDSANYLRITNLRFTASGATIYADEIVRDVVSFLSAQLNGATVMIESPVLDLRDEIYEDVAPTAVLNKLVGLGDNQTPPRQWETGVDVNRVLYFRPRNSSASRTWYIDVENPEFDKQLGPLRNSYYAKYREAGGRTLRTARNTDANSVSRWGVTRVGAVDTQSTNSTEAGVYRDAALNDNKDPKPKANIKVLALFDVNGNRWPFIAARPGDTFVMRGLGINQLSSQTDRFRSFRATRVEVSNGELNVEPEEPPETLEVLVAQAAEGF